MSDIVNTTEYAELTNAVQAIKGAILQSQQHALAAINQEQLALYYGIGRFVSMNTRNKNWGKGFIEAVSEQLRKELPGLRGFSAASLRKMRTFYEEWQMLSDDSFVETNKLVDIESNSFVGTNELPTVQFKIDANFPITAFMNIGFTHHYAIISKVKDVEQRKFYIQFAADTKAKVEDLEQIINDDLLAIKENCQIISRKQSPTNCKRIVPLQCSRMNICLTSSIPKNCSFVIKTETSA